MEKFVRSHNPTILVIFGVTGDLSRKKLLPSILHLYREGVLPKQFKVIGFSRRSWSDNDFRGEIRHILHLSIKSEKDKNFLKMFSFQGGFFNSISSYKALAKKVNAIDRLWKMCTSVLLHLAVPPHYYPEILKNLSKYHLTSKCGPKEGWSRVLVEKPFGDDFDTSVKLDEHLGKIFKEKQIFRVDHYLAKDTIQDILVFRFSNSIFEPIWNHTYIEKIEIQMLEKGDIKNRGEFYDSYGALRDVGQNHILQMLALITMENPGKLDSDSIRRQRASVIESLVSIGPKNLKKSVIRGQYNGYRKVKNVSPDSAIETFFRIKANLSSQRFRGVPIYIESGKALHKTKTDISVYFRAPRPCLSCSSEEIHKSHQNVIRFRIQPHEGISIRFWTKKPGLASLIEQKHFRFQYKKNSINLSGYEKLLYDAIMGDQSLFASTQEVRAAWRFITPIIKNWHSLPLHIYKKGSRGPVQELGIRN